MYRILTKERLKTRTELTGCLTDFYPQSVQKIQLITDTKEKLWDDIYSLILTKAGKREDCSFLLSAHLKHTGENKAEENTGLIPLL